MHHNIIVIQVLDWVYNVTFLASVHTPHFTARDI